MATRKDDSYFFNKALSEYSSRGDGLAVAQLKSLARTREALDKRMSRIQKENFISIAGEFIDKRRSRASPWGREGGRFRDLWSDYAKNEVRKAILRGATKKKAFDVGSGIILRYGAGISRDVETMPPTASISYFLRKRRATDEVRHARSGGRGSNAQSMKGLGLRTAVAPTGSSSAAKTSSRTLPLNVSRRSGAVSLSGS